MAESYFSYNPFLELSFLFILGIVFGSFLNTLTYRLPFIFGIENKAPPFSKFNLLFPRSHCVKCMHLIPIYQNIPIFSYIFLKGRCHFCKRPISQQYPLVETLTALTFFWLYLVFGISYELFFLLLFACSLIVLSIIDLRYKVLPNEITYFLIVLGLCFNYQFEFINFSESVIGAIGGYLFLVFIEKTFFLIRKKHGIGRGDAKLLAGIGSWFGWHPLSIILLFACLLSLVGHTIFQLIKRKSFKDFFNQGLAFGPSLSCSSIIFISYIK